MQRIAVVGGGCQGLACGVQLLEAGFRDVTIISKSFSPDTTSDLAGALWRPFYVEGGDEEALSRWGLDTFRYMAEALRKHGYEATGVSLVNGYELFYEVVADPYWKDQVLGFRRVPEEELKTILPPRKAGRKPFVFGWNYTSIVVEPSLWLPFLTKQFKALGGKLEQREVKDFAELAGNHDLVVNCTGLGAKTLAKDASVHPIRGQVLRVRAPTVKLHWACDEDYKTGRIMYMIPRKDDVIIGGTCQSNDWNTQPTEEDTQSILDMCSEIAPEIRNAEVVKTVVGLRPGRPSVRLETSSIAVPRPSSRAGASALPIVHCYGHGGSGLTLHWGCATDVVRLVEDAIARLIDSAPAGIPELKAAAPQTQKQQTGLRSRL